MPLKTCNDCGAYYETTGRNQKRCKDCAHKLAVAISKSHYDKYYRTGQGSGGNQRGEKNHQWIGGVSPNLYRQKKLQSTADRICERCGTDLSKVVEVEGMQGWWAVHHTDGNSDNGDLSNLELLCKRCHQIEHECWKNLGVKV